MSATSDYAVVVAGCDDGTEFTLALTPEQYVGVALVADASERASEYGCQPVLRVTPA